MMQALQKDLREGEAGGGISTWFRDRRSMQAWGMALILALGWHSVWWVWLGAAPPAPKLLIPQTPSVTYTPFHVKSSDGEALHADVRVLWSPALFSLSTPVGFSRVMLEDQIGIRPSIQPPSGASNLLERLALSGSNPVARLAGSVGEEAAAWMADLPSLHDPEDRTVNETPFQEQRFWVEFSGGLKGANFKRLNFPRNNPQINRMPWEIRAYLEFNGMGVARHVLLDQPTMSKKLNQYILRELLALQLKNATDGQNGYVTIRNRGFDSRSKAGMNGSAP
ncbi:MAG: hypothetical protein V2A34_11285 [Lentisphaerota bacterium]